MAYLGNKPTAVPLTGADLADGIITSAKIANGTITNADLASGVGGSLVKLQSQTISSSVASVTFTSTYLTSTYPIYKIMWYSLNGDANDQAVYIKFSDDNGSTYLTSVVTYVGYNPRNGAGNQTSGQSQNLLPIAQGLEDDAEGSAGGEIVLSNPSNSTQYTTGTLISSHKVTNNVSDEARFFAQGFFIKDTSAINNFQIYPDTGNLTNGTIILYGVTG